MEYIAPKSKRGILTNDKLDVSLYDALYMYMHLWG
jgi:hypothetical protein